MHWNFYVVHLVMLFNALELLSCPCIKWRNSIQEKLSSLRRSLNCRSKKCSKTIFRSIESFHQLRGHSHSVTRMGVFRKFLVPKFLTWYYFIGQHFGSHCIHKYFTFVVATFWLQRASVFDSYLIETWARDIFNRFHSLQHGTTTE